MGTKTKQGAWARSLEWAKKRGYALSLALMATIGILVQINHEGNHSPPIAWLYGHGLIGLSEALIVAVVSAITVDYRIKWKLAKEIADHTGQNAVGHWLPPEARRAIADLLLNPCIRWEYELFIRLTEVEDPDVVENHIRVSYRIENLRSVTVPLRQELYVDKSCIPEMKAEINAFHCRTGDISHYNDSEPSPNRVDRDFSRATRIVYAGEAQLPPNSTTTRFYSSCRTFKRISDELVDSFVCHDTAVGIQITIELPDSLSARVEFDKAPEVESDIPGRWRWPGVLLPGQRVRLTFTRKG